VRVRVNLVRPEREHALLAEAETTDTDRVPICFLLFGTDDRSELDELEIQRADGTPLRELPDPHALTPKAR
jgi:hypothetical protein